MVQQVISLSSLPDHYPSFLSAPEVGDSLLLNTVVPEKLRDISAFTAEHRATLSEGILSDLTRWQAPERAIQEAKKLKEPNAYAVVTGQQAGIATGPLYTLYKAMGAIRTATELATAFPDNHFVPVFWIEADDHDFDEARTISVLDRAADLQSLRYNDGNEQRLHVGDRVVGAEDLETFITEAQEILGQTDFSTELFATIKAAYSGEHTTLADGFARCMYAFIGDTPLIIVSSRNAQLKRLASEIFAHEAQDPTALFNALTNRTEELAEQNIPTPVTPKPGALFLTHQGERLSLDIKTDGYQLRGTAITMSREETATLAKEHPERFSPNVALRPLVQDTILPTAIYLGGPSEVAYLRQLQNAYSVFGITAPAIAPRPFITLVEPKAARGLESSGAILEQLFDPKFEPASYLIDEATERELEDALKEAQHLVENGFGKMGAITNAIDKSLEKALGASLHKAEKELENFGSRLRSALKRKNETEIKRLEGAMALLLPGGKLQERTVSPIYVANKYGMEQLREVLQAIENTPGAMQVIAI